MRRKKKQVKSLIIYTFALFYVIALVFVVAISNKREYVFTNNINTVKAVQSSRIIKLDTVVINENKFININSINELISQYESKIAFTGTLTGYGPDCVGCSGKVACSPYQDVRSGNIYYEDNTYGILRILAADPSIPCGSIIEISNFMGTNFYGIVLDRGSAIQGLTMDLLYETETNIKNIGRQNNINFKIERWGF